MLSIDQTYVHKSVEVKLTGRCAKKLIKNICIPTKGVTVVMYEVTPVDPDVSWCEFVEEDDLYTISLINGITQQKG